MKKNNWEEILLYVDENKENKGMKEMANELGVHHVTLSNRYGGYQLGKSLNGEVNSTDELLLKRELNIKKEMNKLTQQRVMINKEIRNESFYERFVNEYVIPNIKPIKFINKEILKSKGVQTIYLGDIHFNGSMESGEDISRLSNIIYNEWDKSSKIRLVMGGDFIENTHHMQQLINKTTRVMDQVVGVAEHLTNMVVELFKKTNVRIEIYLFIGNHDEIRQMGAKAKDDNEEVVTLIEHLMKAKLSEFKDIYIDDGAHKQKKFDNVWVTHGDTIKGDFRSVVDLKREQNSHYFNGVDHFIIFHTHRYEHTIKKGTNIHYIKAPCVKTWVSQWEYDNNQIGTPGILVEKDGTFKYVPII